MTKTKIKVVLSKQYIQVGSGLFLLVNLCKGQNQRYQSKYNCYTGCTGLLCVCNNKFKQLWRTLSLWFLKKSCWLLPKYLKIVFFTYDPLRYSLTMSNAIFATFLLCFINIYIQMLIFELELRVHIQQYVYVRVCIDYTFVEWLL